MLSNFKQIKLFLNYEINNLEKIIQKKCTFCLISNISNKTKSTYLYRNKLLLLSENL
jgi:hypothetical protein